MSEHRNKIIAFIIAILLISYFLINGNSSYSEGAETSRVETRNDLKVSITDSTGLKEINPNLEYLTIEFDPENLNFFNITNLSLKNSKGGVADFGQGVETFYQISINREKPIVINEKTDLIVNSGASPVGVSFRENTCTGFLTQYQTFNPPISKECPNPITLLKDQGFNLSRNCTDFLSNISSCEVVTDFPDNIDFECKSIVEKNLNYNSCVNTYKQKPDFYKDSWRIFLNEEKEFWSGKNETISIVNNFGTTIFKKIFLEF